MEKSANAERLENCKVAMSNYSKDSIQPVILCGGSGTRLWPLSRKSLPKQFVKLVSKKSLLHSAFERVSGLRKYLPVMVVANTEHQFLVRDEAVSANVFCKIILEPVGRDTAPAMAAAALNCDHDQILLFIPADHHVPDTDCFVDTVRQGLVAAKEDMLVTFGVKPKNPHTGYGYIRAHNSWVDVNKMARDDVFKVEEFVEKPDLKSALSYIESGEFYWNTGMLLVRAGALIKSLHTWAPDILNAARRAVEAQAIQGDCISLNSRYFEECRSDSIDFAVLERDSNVVMVPFHSEWSDVGSWNAVEQLVAPDSCMNRVVGAGQVFYAKSTYIHASARPVIAIGTDNLVVIDTVDAVLVAAKSHVEQVKEVVAELQKQNVIQATQHRHTSRPWGMYDAIDEGDCFKVKRITVSPGESLSLQSHRHRAEHWIVVKGLARVTCGNRIYLLRENESTFIPVGIKHRLENPGLAPLEVIEVQSGAYLGEDDIERFDDFYGRTIT